MLAVQVALARGRNPFEVFMLAACVLSGVTTITGAAEPSSVERAVHPVVLISWSACLVAGGVLGLIGITMKPPTGLLVERAGMAFLAGPGFAYVVGLAYFNGTKATVVGSVITAFAVAAVVRGVQISIDLWRIRRAPEV